MKISTWLMSSDISDVNNLSLLCVAVNRFSGYFGEIFERSFCAMPEWTFLTNHALVLSFLAQHPRITARELSTAMVITERAVRRFIADLHAAGYISKKREGRRIKYRINPDLNIRHNTHQEIAIGDFLKVLGWKKGTETKQYREVASEEMR